MGVGFRQREGNSSGGVWGVKQGEGAKVSAG